MERMVRTKSMTALTQGGSMSGDPGMRNWQIAPEP
jgi:hypothetical protein